MPQFPADTGPGLPAASCPAWAAPWVSPQGSSFLGALKDELPHGRYWAKATTPEGTALGCGVCPPPPPTSYKTLPLLLFPSWASGQSWCLCQAWEDPTPHVMGASALRGFFFFFSRNMSQYGNPVLTSLRHRGTGTTRGMMPDTALTIGLTPLLLGDSPASSLWRDHYISKSLPHPHPSPPPSHPDHKGTKSEGL